MKNNSLGSESLTKSLTEPLNLNKILLNVNRKYHHYFTPNQVIIFDNIDSTNNYLIQQIIVDNKEIFLCMAEQQTSGKGQRQNTWFSPKGNIYLSLAWQFSNKLQQLSGLSLAISVAVLRALQQYGVHNVNLKWPNDILYQQKKLAGILIENVKQSSVVKSVIGLGLNFAIEDLTKINKQQNLNLIDLASIINISHNYNQNIDIDQNRNIDRNNLIGLILNNILNVVLLFEKQGLVSFIPEWQNFNGFKNKLITVKSNSKIITGINRGINCQGELLLQIDNKLSSIASGHILTATLNC